jgi:uracil-DNA glycosylase
MAAVCRCFPGNNVGGGERVPDAQEITNCSRWLSAEMRCCGAAGHPDGKLAILQLLQFEKLTDVIGKQFRGATEVQSSTLCRCRIPPAPPPGTGSSRKNAARYRPATHRAAPRLAAPAAVKPT